MELNIFGAQWNKDFTYKVSHHLMLEIENALTPNLLQISDYSKLNIFISTQIDNITESKIDFKLKNIKKEIELYLFLPSSEIRLVSGYVFNDKKFDFKHKVDAYKIYPILSYVKFVFTGLKTFFYKMNFATVVDLNNIEIKLINTIEDNIEFYNFRPEEIIHLQEIIDKSHWAYKTNSDWLESEIGKKWIALSEKYQIKNDGSLILLDEK
jgi:hypothetical protein